MNAAQLVYVYVKAFVEELAAGGLRHVCLAPGSRSAPLAMLLARQAGIRVWTHVDERSAAFFALGMARALREPVAVVCTSGTAAANFYPAVIEARYGRVPLVVLTADRPHELRDVGALQAIDQLRLYGPHVKWFVEMAPPDASPEVLAYVRAAARRAMAVAQTDPAGPVHLNFPFREPLVPEPPDPAELPASPGPLRSPELTGPPGPRRALQGRRTLSAPAVAQLAAELAGYSRGLIVCGPQDDPELPAAAGRLAAALGFPVLADPLSGVRCGPHDRQAVVDGYDTFLRVPEVAEALQPDVIVRTGALPVSKTLQQFLGRQRGARQILVDGGDGWRDPLGVATDVLHVDPAWLLAAVAEEVGRRPRARTARAADGLFGAASGPAGEEAGPAGLAGAGPAVRDGWLAIWAELNGAARRAVDGALATMNEPFEGRVFAELAELLPDGATLFAGNSMPVRDLDAFFPTSSRRVRCLANRGASGIDGVVSTALGVAAVSREPVVLAIGDLSFYHDLNGLLAARLHGLSLTVVLVNNDGGGIFHFLPQARHPEHFEALFGTPTGLDFQPAVEMYGGRFVRASDWAAFRRAVREGMDRGGLWVVELRTDRRRNVAQHEQVWAAAAEAVREAARRLGLLPAEPTAHRGLSAGLSAPAPGLPALATGPVAPARPGA